MGSGLGAGPGGEEPHAGDEMAGGRFRYDGARHGSQKHGQQSDKNDEESELSFVHFLLLWTTIKIDLEGIGSRGENTFQTLTASLAGK